MSNIWYIWARILYSVPLCITGFIYLFKPQGAVESLTSFIPGGVSLIYGAGVLWILFGGMIALNLRTRWATWGIIGLVSAYTVMIHVPAIYTGDYLNIVWFEFLRDLSLLGGALFIMASEKQRLEEEKQDGFEHQDWHATLH